MKQLTGSIKFRLNIISGKLTSAFTLVEMIITISVSTLLISSIIFTAFFVHYSLLRAKQTSISLNEMSDCLNLITADILNSDYFLRHPILEYEFEKTRIVFFSNGGMTEYDYKENAFYIRKNNKERKYNFIKSFEINYYDADDFLLLPENIKAGKFPLYCEFKILFKDNRLKKVKLRL